MQPLFTDDVMALSQGSYLLDPIRARAASAFDKTIPALATSGKRILRVLEVGAGMTAA